MTDNTIDDNEFEEDEDDDVESKKELDNDFCHDVYGWGENENGLLCTKNGKFAIFSRV